ncbi:hypothetical protein QQ045_015940 [Rhodiola kirilowii]
MSTSSSLRLIICSRIPHFLNPKTHLFKPHISSFPLKPPNLSLLRPISIQRIPTTPSSSPSPPPPSSLQPIEDLPPKLQEIVKLFQSVPDSKAKYEQLLFYGKTLAPLNSQFKTDDNKVQGCVSQVWVRAYLDEGKNVIFEADSDSVLTKGLAALLVQGLSGRPVDEILRVSPDFMVLLGLQQSLTPSRNNGFLNMLKLMQKKALQAYVQADKGMTLESANGSADKSNSVTDEIVSPESNSDEIAESPNTGDHVDLGESVRLGSRGERIKAVLTRELSPAELVIEDVSYQHAGHAGVRGADGETHFNVKIVSDKFEGKSLVKRHRLIYELLQEELQSGLHALSIVAKTPSEVNR